MNRLGDSAGGLGSTWSRLALLSMSVIALVAVAALSDDCKFCTFGSNSDITSMTASNGSLGGSRVNTKQLNPKENTHPCCHDAT